MLIKKNFKNKIIGCILLVLLNITPVFASSGAEGVSELIDMGLTFIGLVPSFFCAFFIFNAVVARGEVKMEGSNPQAQGKMVTNIIEAVIMGAFAGLYYVKFIPILKNMLNV